MSTSISRRPQRRGFKLVEALIAMVFVGVLSAIAIDHFGEITQHGDEAVCRTSIASATTAATSHLASYGRYPETLRELLDSGALVLPPDTHLDDSGNVAVSAELAFVMWVGTPPSFTCDLIRRGG